MTAPPALFNARLRRLRLARAESLAARTGDGADFLRRRVADDLAWRIGAVQRTFPLAIELAPRAGALKAALAAAGLAERIGRLVEADGAPLPSRRPDLVAYPERPPLSESMFDLIVSPLALHGVNDLVGALVQMRRALKPDGLFLGALFGGATLTELRQSLTEAEVETLGGAGPRVSPVLDPADGGALLQRAGFAMPVVDTDLVTARYDHPLALMLDLRAMGETNALADRPGRPLTRAVLARLADIYRRDHADPDGRLRASFEIVTLTGWTPR